MMSLHVWHNMPARPHHPQNHAALECAPPILEGIDGISHPADLFPSSGEKEHHKKNRGCRPGDRRFGEWSPQEKHYPIRQRHNNRHQEHDGRIPNLVFDPLYIENALQESTDATKFLFPIHKEESRNARTYEHKRTHRKIKWKF